MTGWAEAGHTTATRPSTTDSDSDRSRFQGDALASCALWPEGNTPPSCERVRAPLDRRRRKPTT